MCSGTAPFEINKTNYIRYSSFVTACSKNDFMSSLNVYITCSKFFYERFRTVKILVWTFFFMSCSNGLVTCSEFFMSRSNGLVTRSEIFMSRLNGLVTRVEFSTSLSNG